MAIEEYSSEQIEQWREQLEELATQPRTVFSKKQAVEALIEPIEQTLSVHSYEVVAQQLHAWGLEITAGSLKQYVTRYRRELSPSSKTVNKAKRKHPSSPEMKELDRESIPMKEREQQGESNPQSGVNLISNEDEVAIVNPSAQSATQKEQQVEPTVEHLNIKERLPNSTTWEEPTFNRNRVRPQRILS